MAAATPESLPENAGLAFLGEAAWPASRLTEREARNLLAAPNRCGRPNVDVLRRRLAVVDGEPSEGWQIDFPDHFTAQEAALYEQPFALLQKRSGGGWQNPHAQPDLRRALARLSRFLALPADATAPDWRWIEEDLLPDASLLVVARDDDYANGVLQSALFALWWDHFDRASTRWSPISTSATGVARDTDAHPKAILVRTLESFPFPWPPATALSALTAAQEEHRHAIARAARRGDLEQLNVAVLAAHGWAGEMDDAGLLERLAALHCERGG